MKRAEVRQSNEKTEEQEEDESIRIKYDGAYFVI